MAISTVIPWDTMLHCTETDRLESTNRRYFKSYYMVESEDETVTPNFIQCHERLDKVDMEDYIDSGEYEES